MKAVIDPKAYHRERAVLQSNSGNSGKPTGKRDHQNTHSDYLKRHVMIIIHNDGSDHDDHNDLSPFEEQSLR